MRRGYALSIVLWIVAAMGAITIFLSSLAKERITIAIGIDNKIKATLKAQESLDLILFYGSTGKFYLNTISNAHLEDLNISTQLYIDGRNTTINESNITLTDGGALYNLLFPYVDLIGRELEDEYVIKESIIDWIDDDIFMKLNGAEDDYYKQISDDHYEARDKQAIQDVAELALIKGVDKQKLEKIKDNFLYTWAIRVNLTTVSDKKLQTILNLPQEAIGETLQLKEENLMEFIRKVNSYTVGNDNFIDLYGFVPSKSLRVQIQSQVGNALSKINATIELHYKNKERFIYKYNIQ
ncbi:MAG: general secretion pathway protein GspK [Campylobacterales bacterium]|nr:general secretion pathway protein GspK [Campylobacterales bacterium]